MKTLYLDCNMGVAGDMLMSALYELIDNKEDFLNQMHSLGLPNLEIIPITTAKCGIFGTHIDVIINGECEHCEDVDTHSNHHTDHCHHKAHSNYGLKDITHIVGHLNTSATVKDNVIAVYTSIAKAESLVHNCEIDNIHFHELGSLDAIADITGVCILMDMIKPNQIYASKIHVGSGHVKCSHGILPVPAPATLHLLEGIPIYSKDEIRGELATPTGVALLRHFVTKYTCTPSMTVSKIGYGMGTKDFPMANCVRATIGEIDCTQTNRIYELSCNLDDMTGEELGFAMNLLMEQGALDVYSTPIYMKKWRNANILTVTTFECEIEKFVKLIFKHTTTLGIRKKEFERFELSRSCDTINTTLGDVNIKHSKGYGTDKSKFEFDQIAKIAKDNNLSLFDVKKIIAKEMKLK